MIEEKDVNLKKYNTLHLNGIAKNLFVPENEKELMEIVKKIKEKKEKYYILSGGSNLLLNDSIKLQNVIYMNKIDKNMHEIKENEFYIGASNRIQEVINFVNNYNCGGFEELYSLPALFGGIIYMNAGIGVKFSISEYIKKVKVFNIEENKIQWLSKEECEFSHRKSIFQNNEYIILGAEIKVIPQSQEESKLKIKKRIELCKDKQEWGNGCFGTCFSKANIHILKLAKLIKCKSGEIRFGSKNCNWFVNDGNGTFKDTMKLIKLCVFLHKITFQKIELEVRIWDDLKE